MKKINSHIRVHWLMCFIILPILTFIFFPILSKAQSTSTTNTHSIIVGFYNFENFYDTTNQLNVADEEFLPNSAKGYKIGRASCRERV